MPTCPSGISTPWLNQMLEEILGFQTSCFQESYSNSPALIVSLLQFPELITPCRALDGPILPELANSRLSKGQICSSASLLPSFCFPISRQEHGEQHKRFWWPNQNRLLPHKLTWDQLTRKFSHANKQLCRITFLGDWVSWVTSVSPGLLSLNYGTQDLLPKVDTSLCFRVGFLWLKFSFVPNSTHFWGHCHTAHMHRSPTFPHEYNILRELCKRFKRIWFQALWNSDYEHSRGQS